MALGNSFQNPIKKSEHIHISGKIGSENYAENVVVLRPAVNRTNPAFDSLSRSVFQPCFSIFCFFSNGRDKRFCQFNYSKVFLVGLT